MPLYDLLMDRLSSIPFPDGLNSIINRCTPDGDRQAIVRGLMTAGSLDAEHIAREIDTTQRRGPSLTKVAQHLVRLGACLPSDSCSFIEYPAIARPDTRIGALVLVGQQQGDVPPHDAWDSNEQKHRIAVPPQGFLVTTYLIMDRAGHVLRMPGATHPAFTSEREIVQVSSPTSVVARLAGRTPIVSAMGFAPFLVGRVPEKVLRQQGVLHRDSLYLYVYSALVVFAGFSVWRGNG